MEQNVRLNMTSTDVKVVEPSTTVHIRRRRMAYGDTVRECVTLAQLPSLKVPMIEHPTM